MKTYLFRHLGELEKRIRRGKVSLFLDFDGTLIPIVSRPEKAFLPFLMKETVQRLSRLLKVAIISGRSIEDLKERVNIPGIVYIGNNGLEINGDGLYFRSREAVEARGAMERLMADISTAISENNIKGAIVEDKRLTVSIHYRLLDKRDIEAFLSLTRSTLKPYLEKGLFRIVEGKKVIEVRPNVQWDKGKAVEWLMVQDGFQDSIPIYIGDDETDRDAFRAIRGRGISIAVGPMLQDADYYLRGQGEVEKFLRWLKSLPEGLESSTCL